MTTDSKYNGWTNYETWLCNLWFDDFSWSAKECSTVEELAERIEEYVTESLDEQIGKTHGFAADILNAAMREINFREIAEHYEEDLAKPEPEEEEAEEETA